MRLRCIERLVHLDPSAVFPYAPSSGKHPLRKKWKELILEKNPSIRSTISLPIVTNGITHGLSIAGYLFVDPGEPIILSDKFWGNYSLIFGQGFGAELCTYNTFQKGKLDLASFEKSLAKEKTIILLNFPNNPSGYSPTIEEAHHIAAIIKKYAQQGGRCTVMIDDAYFGLIYEKNIFKESLFSLLASLHENVLAVKIDGATKEDYVWGLRIGFLTFSMKGISQEACQALEAKTAGAIRGNISNASHLSQSLLLHASGLPEYAEEKKEKFQILKARYLAVKETASRYREYFSPLPFNSGYFMCIELKKGLKGDMVQRMLLEEFDTGVIAMGNLLRIAFSSVSEKQIPELFENIYWACKKIRG